MKVLVFSRALSQKHKKMIDEMSEYCVSLKILGSSGKLDDMTELK